MIDLFIIGLTASIVQVDAPPQTPAHAHIAPIWEATYVYHCPSRTISFSMVNNGGYIQLIHLNAGQSSTPDNIIKINNALKEMRFKSITTFCISDIIEVIFEGWETDPFTGNSLKPSVRISSPSIQDQDIEIQ